MAPVAHEAPIPHFTASLRKVGLAGAVAAAGPSSSWFFCHFAPASRMQWQPAARSDVERTAHAASASMSEHRSASTRRSSRR